ncbi:9955_t:CDS:2 [Diversispora eburnea]|uniref:9955_t:CDS:1 n=1 Tax=Diversispora eburnea TaxID=1213867 RepID=A0A9N9BH69_9GLOM|nr:9955_t:CDS:2 [Diversispora eburnea]
MSSYSRVPHSEDDVREVELQVPSSNAEASSSSSSNTILSTHSNDEIIESELTPMIIEEVIEGTNEVENETETENDSNNNSNSSGSTRFSILNKIKKKIMNQAATLPSSTDGVFANLSAKPDTQSDNEDKNPPPYETAAADAAPPYLETTIIAPGLCGDEMLVEGLPVGNFFSFVWNMLVSMSFQFVGFLLTYLLHTTHSAKNGSRAGLGITLVQYGFYLRGRSLQEEGGYYSSYGDTDMSDKELLARSAWLSISDYIRVKRLESIMRSNPEENA